VLPDSTLFQSCWISCDFFLDLRFGDQRPSVFQVTSIDYALLGQYNPDLVRILDPAATEDVIENVPEFIHDPKSGEFFES
ncbi:unnamed protein product, partial [Hymenolepis diminuta]